MKDRLQPKESTAAGVTDDVTAEATDGIDGRLLTRRQLLIDSLIVGGATLATAAAGRLGVVPRLVGWLESLGGSETAFAGESEPLRARTAQQATNLYTPGININSVTWQFGPAKPTGLIDIHGTALADIRERMPVNTRDRALELMQGWNPDFSDDTCPDRIRGGRTIITPSTDHQVMTVANVGIVELLALDDPEQQLPYALWEMMIKVGDTMENDANRATIIVGIFNPTTGNIDHWIMPRSEALVDGEVPAQFEGSYPMTEDDVHKRVTPRTPSHLVRWEQTGMDNGKPVWHGTYLGQGEMDVFTGSDALLTLQGWQGGYRIETCEDVREGRSVVAPGFGNKRFPVANVNIRPVDEGEDQEREAVWKARRVWTDLLWNDPDKQSIAAGLVNWRGAQGRLESWIYTGSERLPRAVAPPIEQMTPEATATSTPQPPTATATPEVTGTATGTPVQPTATEALFTPTPTPTRTPTPATGSWRINLPNILISWRQ